MAQQTRLFVSNITDNTTENDLRAAFSVYGEVSNVDLKSKTENDDKPKKFAFVTLSALNYEVESCIKNFGNELFKGNKIYVTKARESFLERLQREREQAQKKPTVKGQYDQDLPKNNPVINLSEKLNPRKRNVNNVDKATESKHNNKDRIPKKARHNKGDFDKDFYNTNDEKKKELPNEIDLKKQDSDKKRLESMKKKRDEFKEKQKIIKTGLIGIDKIQNKKIKFSDDDEPVSEAFKIDSTKYNKVEKANILFEDDDSDNDLNFKIKEQYEGKKGQKVLDLKSRYKSDKRFTLDERFVDEDLHENQEEVVEEIVIGNEDEKTKQLNILQDVLGVQIKPSSTVPPKDPKKNKPKLGMLRFDPNHPDHAKFIVSVEEKHDQPKKTKKKKSKEVNNEDKEIEQSQPEVQKVEVSKEQFYKVSDTLKEAIAKPTTFSLRSLFSRNEDGKENEIEDEQDHDADYKPIETSNKIKMKNPLDPGGKNPFVYDSSESEDEQDDKVKKEILPENTQPKAVWKENFFFSEFDDRLQEGLKFFNNYQNGAQKERRELKYLMKKRIHNSERKNQMFQKKIGGRKKSMKKRFRTKR